MPTFVVTGPDGKKYKVTAPEGATGEEIKSRVSQAATTWGEDVRDAQGNPLGPQGGEGFDAEGNPLGMYGTVTDTSGQKRPDLMDATKSAAAGAVQGAGGALYDFPMDIAGGVEKGVTYALTEGGGALADAVGAEAVADWWREGGRRRMEQLDNPASLSNQRVTDVVEGISPTPEGMEAPRFVAQLIGGAAVPLGPKRPISGPVNPATREVIGGQTIPTGYRPGPRAPAARSAAKETIEAGAQNQVRVMTSDVRPPTTFTGKVARAAGERIPYAGTGGPRAAQQQERVEAVRRFAQEYGYDEAATYLDDISADLITTRGNQLSNLTRAKDSVIDAISGTVATPRAIAEIDRQIASLAKLEADEVGPVIGKLQNWKAALLGETTRIDTGLLDAAGKPIIREIAPDRSLRTIEELRKIMGEAFKDPNLAHLRSLGEKATNRIYAPLRDDMGATIRERGGPEAFNRWKGANDRLAAMAGELEDSVFKSVLRKAETTPENVARLLFSKKPSEVRRLVENLSPEGMKKARAGIIHLAVEKAGGIENISPDKFANAIAQSSRAAGVVFGGDDLARLNGLQRVLQATKQAGVAAAAPPTGAQNMPIIGGFAAGSMLDFSSSLALFGGAGGLARLYESAATRDLLVGLSKTKPGSKAEGAFLDRIATAITSQAEIQSGNIRRAANENAMVSPLAAQDDQPQ